MRSFCFAFGSESPATLVSSRPLVQLLPVVGSHSSFPAARCVSVDPRAFSASSVGESGGALKSPASTSGLSGARRA